MILRGNVENWQIHKMLLKRWKNINSNKTHRHFPVDLNSNTTCICYIVNRMSQSMYVIGRSSQQSFRTDSQSSGVSFFVDLSDVGGNKEDKENDGRPSRS